MLSKISRGIAQGTKNNKVSSAKIL